MRILYVCSEYPPTTHGGIGVIIKDLAEGLSENGHSVAVVGYDPLIKTIRQENENGVWVTRLPLKKYWSLRFGRYSLSLEPVLSRMCLSNQLEKLIKTFKPDVVESFDWSGPLWKKPSVKLIVRMHGANTALQIYEHKKPSEIISYFEKKNIAFADALCAVSNHIGELTLSALKLNEKEFTCLYNFVDTEKFKPLKQINRDPYKILYVGRIHSRKGLTEFFNILRLLFKLNKKVHIDLAGLYKEIYKMELLKILPKNQQERVRFLGKIPHAELPVIFNSARLLVMPSRAEAFGLTAIEAMVCGTASILTNKASGPEIVEEGRTGWLMDINNPIETANKINALLQQQHLMDKVALEGRRHILENFSKEKIINQNITYYNNLIK